MKDKSINNNYNNMDYEHVEKRQVDDVYPTPEKRFSSCFDVGPTTPEAQITNNRVVGKRRPEKNINSNNGNLTPELQEGSQHSTPDTGASLGSTPTNLVTPDSSPEYKQTLANEPDSTYHADVILRESSNNARQDTPPPLQERRHVTVDDYDNHVLFGHEVQEGVENSDSEENSSRDYNDNLDEDIEEESQSPSASDGNLDIQVQMENLFFLTMKMSSLLFIFVLCWKELTK
eukprot:UN29732